MDLKRRINAFVALGKYLGKISKDTPIGNHHSDIEPIIQRAMDENGWFTLENIKFALQRWAKALSEENIQQWISNYDFEALDAPPNKAIAVIMAGNVPLVGFHDFLSVLITGNKVMAKLSSNDKVLLPFIAKQLIAIEPDFKHLIEFSEGKIDGFDAVIATGSNNTSRYFDYYFGKYPHIIRKNRNSVAVLTGSETLEELKLLSNDIFRYFGLGCRNVSKIYIPQEYHFERFFKAMFSWKEIIHNHKYINNYDYNKAVYLMDGLPLLDNEFLLLKEDQGFSSPIAVLFYERYESLEHLGKILSAQSENLQCVVSRDNLLGGVQFGDTQSPQLWDYADNEDTVAFLLKLT